MLFSCGCIIMLWRKQYTASVADFQFSKELGSINNLARFVTNSSHGFQSPFLFQLFNFYCYNILWRYPYFKLCCIISFLLLSLYIYCLPSLLYFVSVLLIYLEPWCHSINCWWQAKVSSRSWTEHCQHSSRKSSSTAASGKLLILQEDLYCYVIFAHLLFIKT